MVNGRERDESQTTSEENEQNKSNQARRLPPTAPTTAPRYAWGLHDKIVMRALLHQA